jgi:AcrR family transcriptional regulator
MTAPNDHDPTPGLRERKKRETRATISRVALELFDAQGFHETTLPQIAERANVAPRTVSAYFPAKEELVFPEHDEGFSALSARLAERPEGETFVEGLRDWIVAVLDVDDAELARRRKVRAVVEAEPALRTYERGLQDRLERIIAAAAADDLGLRPDELLPRMVAAAAMAALDALAKGAGGELEALREKGPALIDDAMAFVGAGIEVLRARSER